MFLIDIFKENIFMADKAIKNSSHSMPPGEWKLSKDISSQTLKKKRPKLGKLTIPNAGENVEQQKLLLLVGMQNGIAFLKENLAVPYKN